ncbi:hypothetical protein NPX13_g7296 [Xylaria arbuscula]|uniref:Protein kinase domain-containing protein n=1 Tax=Xylaria arbuscula TaxID=114810 RepID=A0A9W8NAR6_9PEZI|nr:hypothetical protein NPX13_g7296 [Xylaria arbuscula]
MIQPPTAAAVSAGPDDAVVERFAMRNLPHSSHSSSAPPSPQPHISIEQIPDAATESTPAPHLSAFPRYSLESPETSQEDPVAAPPNQMDGISQSTVNQYRIKEEIGRGSYGAVHLATDQFGTEYAVKEFSKSRLRKRAQSHILRRPGPGTPHRQHAPGMGLNNFYRKQFGRQEDAEAKDALYLIRAEIAIMKKLDHPNLVALIEVLDDPEDDSLYMVLEMCKKGVVMKIDLDQQATPYENELCRTWFRDLILGIEYLHAQNIIHRDIKPDNLLLTEDDVLKIVDFGVSEMFEKSNEMMTNKSAGSPAFIPPELCQVRHGDVSGKAVDVWSMGVTLYCLKYGRLPFNGQHVLDMYEAIREKPFHLPDGEDPDFVDLITRILDKNSSTRIKLPEIRNHPWVTRNGEDPLLPEEENCSDVVETPNELELNHAFTRKMDHLICVLKAIRRFKGLISQSRATTPRSPHPPRFLEKAFKVDPPTSRSVSPPHSEATEPEQQKSVAQEAAELIEQRKAYLKSGLNLRGINSGHKAKEELHLSEISGSSEKSTPFLGIGTGGGDDDSENISADIVAESPTGIDFDVYDRAFETEIRRIRSDRKKNRSWTYMTKMLGEKERDKYVGDDCMIVEAGKSLATTAKAKTQSLVHQHEVDCGSSHRSVGERGQHAGDDTQSEEGGIQGAVDAAKEKGSRFADLVVSLTRDMKDKATT